VKEDKVDFNGLGFTDKEILCMCPYEGMIDLISKKWALLVVGVLGNKGTARYTKIEEDLKGIRPKTLTTILRDLEKEEIITRKAYAEVPPRVEYTLTKDGYELRKAIVPLLQWAALRSKNKKESCPILKPEMIKR